MGRALQAKAAVCAVVRANRTHSNNRHRRGKAGTQVHGREGDLRRSSGDVPGKVSRTHPRGVITALFKIGGKLIYNIVLVSGVQHRDSVMHIYTSVFRLFSFKVYYKIMSGVPCAIQQVLVDYLFYVPFPVLWPLLSFPHLLVY